MLRSMKSMEGYAIAATDGVIGHVKDFYFDDFAWVVRYLVVQTGDWLLQRKVLISPISVREPNWIDKIFPVSISRTRVQGSPPIDTDKPISRQHEEGFLRHFDYPYYWAGAGLWGGGLYPSALAFDSPDFGSVASDDGKAHSSDDPHLRSSNAVMRYSVHAKDGDIGHVKHLLVEDMTWAIRYLVVSTSKWWGGHDVLIAPKWIDDINWSESKFVVDLSQQAIKDSPAYDSSKLLTRELEIGTCSHYGQEGYWPREAGNAPPRLWA
jgi:hypothetical protein